MNAFEVLRQARHGRTRRGDQAFPDRPFSVIAWNGLLAIHEDVDGHRAGRGATGVKKGGHDMKRQESHGVQCDGTATEKFLPMSNETPEQTCKN